MNLRPSFYLGTTAGLILPLMQIGLLKMTGATPLLGWEMGLWALINALFCGAAVPLFDGLAKRLVGWFFPSGIRSQPLAQ